MLLLQFNTTSGYLAARAAAAQQGTASAAVDVSTNATNDAPANAMAALEAANKPSMNFVPAKERVKSLQEQQAASEAEPAQQTANTDEIAIDDEDE